MAFVNQASLEATGFRKLGSNVFISEAARIYGADRIEIGDNTRIDDFCILSAGEDGIRIGSHVHIACYSALIGRAAIEMADFSGLSARVSVYSSSEDYSGAAMTNPTLPESYRKVDSRRVRIGRHAIIGAGSVILPGVNIGDGSSVGALCLVTRDLEPWGVYVGSPARRVGNRARDILELEKQFKSEGRGEPL